MNNILFSHNSDHWATPKKIYDAFVKNGYIDPCPLHCEVDNLHTDFGDNDLFINPPYSNISEWVDFAINHLNNHKNNSVVLLIPSRTDTKYFHKLINQDYGVRLLFVKGRLHFNDSKNSAPFPSVLVSISYKLNDRTFGGYYA